ncbi:gliding motility-associated ABC transporter substrate-binding protein GldG [Pontibacter qinzhouensis]|uniref:Gliding motility-associated ABC transporter substrate-binding protein GldG n=1 Tax=Pontibacter qinzhouensis TaxID=2603253 RepID=A0A5C8K0S1_9BACT|nr:gliding motility-associated ABC transporter substrate-binding protein GldG [Pontibacter qinzhouensis]TXK44310.1 gliding motility-associated ABC transporter substrate-binding protein GldG [Pontibacter qinzhouensis]
MPYTTKRRQKPAPYLFWLAGTVLLASLLAVYYFRFVLTEATQTSLAPATVQLLGELEGEVVVEVHLQEPVPEDLKPLEQSVRETLDAFGARSGGKLRYAFLDATVTAPDKDLSTDSTVRTNKERMPINREAIEQENNLGRLEFPKVLVKYGSKETSVTLLKGNLAVTKEDRLRRAIEGVEYELAMAIKKVAFPVQKKIGYVVGQGELESTHVADLMHSLQEFYQVKVITLPELSSLQGFDLVIIVKPSKPYAEADKYKIDQFIMHGGKALFFIDALHSTMDSIGIGTATARPAPHNLDDLLLQYGVRLNHTLIMDLNSAFIPVFTGKEGEEKVAQAVNWRFYPQLYTFSNHQISRNIDAVYARFVGTMDTVQAAGIRKTPLVYSSKYTRIVQAPVPITLEEALAYVEQEKYVEPPQAVGYLLEGSFTSLYQNKGTPAGAAAGKMRVKGEKSHIAVFADGDLPRNELNEQTGQPYLLGFDHHTGDLYANKELALNTVHYLLQPEGLINARSKEHGLHRQ